MNEINTQQSLNVQASKAVDSVSRPASEEAAKAKLNVVENSEPTDIKGTEDVKQAEQEANELSEEQVEQAVAQLNDYVQQTQRKLEFKVDDDSGQTVVKVFDKGSEELIRQIPNEEALQLAKQLSQQEPLVLFSAQV